MANKPKRLEARAAAAKVLVDVLVHGHSLSTALPKWQPSVILKDRALLQALVYGVSRWHLRLDAILQCLLSKPFKRKDADINALLLLGLYQLIYLRVPDHAAVGATVSATKTLGKGWARGVCNGVLREFQRRSEELQQQVDQAASAQYAHPDWLLKRLQANYPEQWSQIVEANNQHPPMVLRVNQSVMSRDDYLARLAAVGIDAKIFTHGNVGLILDKPVDVSRLPGFDDGWASVQDGAAQLAGALLDVKPGQRVLDACAAPGGKTAHIAESEPALAYLLAIDSEAPRVVRLQETLTRLKLEAEVKTADAANPQQWWDGDGFDRILLDAPCSATGVIRRHPDIKQLRRDSDIPVLVDLQAKILRALWPLLNSGGMLLYATCSVLPEENHEQITRFLAEQKDAVAVPIDATWGQERAVGRQILPTAEGMDGFYYACLAKKGPGSPSSLG